MDRREGWTDEQFDIVLAHVLRIGVGASALVVAIGGIVFLVRHGLERPLYHTFRGQPGAASCSWVCSCSSRRRLRE